MNIYIEEYKICLNKLPDFRAIETHNMLPGTLQDQEKLLIIFVPPTIWGYSGNPNLIHSQLKYNYNMSPWW